jgi:hypothetical protein
MLAGPSSTRPTARPTTGKKSKAVVGDRLRAPQGVEAMRGGAIESVNEDVERSVLVDERADAHQDAVTKRSAPVTPA